MAMAEAAQPMISRTSSPASLFLNAISTARAILSIAALASGPVHGPRPTTVLRRHSRSDS
jgi:hypothetical protein